MNTNFIYLDNSATTRVDPRVVEAMLPMFTEFYGNGSSNHVAGYDAGARTSEARLVVSKFFNAAPQEILFTGTGSEADNFAVIEGVKLRPGKKHIITTEIEHKAILNTFAYMATLGYETTYLPVDGEGRISLADLKKSIRPDTALISIMMANNETGVTMPVAEIGKIAKENGIIFHIDAVQAAGKTPLDAEKLNADFITVAGHKFYAPKGIGVLYIKEKHLNALTPLIHGGSQEHGLRAGTENTPYIIGIAKAMKIIMDDNYAESAIVTSLRDLFEKRLQESLKDVVIHSKNADRIGNVTSIGFKYIEAEALIGYVPKVCFSLGSACNAQDEDNKSHVLKAMGVDPVTLRGTARFSFGRFNTEAQINEAADLIIIAVNKLRQMSPIYQNI